MNEYKRMREYTHEEFVNLIEGLSEEELLYLSANYGGYPVLFRMALDSRVCHIPFIQTGAAIIIVDSQDRILLQERTDRNKWGLPGGCQELGERLENTAIREAKEETGLTINIDDLILIDTLSGESRKNSYPNGDIVYNNTSLYMVIVDDSTIKELKSNSESKRLEFRSLDELPDNLMDRDLIERYIQYISKKLRK